ncbi:MAG: AbrB/MazE/SpoVT family DNA-binding domain-containing protein, partial [Herpetosiphonaceae bacterium]|nr:AbrB/MazE/SpoVT family DNA-binding domain-containing protein [Herpetosiphonaceae bacterium]
MEERLTVVTRKGQVTIPVEIRRALELKEGDQVAFVMGEDNQVRLKRSTSVVERTAGALRGNVAHLTTEQLRE